MTNIAANLALQAQRYDTALRGCLAVVRCVSFTVWGFTDKYSWIPGTFPGDMAIEPLEIPVDQRAQRQQQLVASAQAISPPGASPD